MIDRNHPAVEAVELAAQRWIAVTTGMARSGTPYMLSVALPHLTADDLRNTPAGRALMAEAWDALIESMSASGEFHDVDLRTMQRLNPYRGGDA